MTRLSLAFSFFEPQVWEHVPIEDPRGKALADRHYPREIRPPDRPDDDGYIAPGFRFLLLHQGPVGLAIWAVVRNRFRGQWHWRNSIFRNESGTQSSDLIVSATRVTFELWERRYKALPPEDLVSEIDILATARRRSKHARPGRCYEKAGWIWVRDTPREHGRSPKSIWKAPR